MDRHKLWMIDHDSEFEDLPRVQAAYDMAELIDSAYADRLSEEVLKYPYKCVTEEDRDYHRLCGRINACHQKLQMMHYAKRNAISWRKEFETTQNMTFPCLFGTDRTKLLFYAESTVLFARNALDVAAPVFSQLFFGRRIDSFNDLTKKIMKDTDAGVLQSYFTFLDSVPDHAFRMLCGASRGRALRDIIVHQTNLNLAYAEYKVDSEKEKLFVIASDVAQIEFDLFLEIVCDGVEEMLGKLCSEAGKLSKT